MGSGTLILTGNNTYVGVTLNGGVFSVSSDANLGTVPGSATAGNIIISGGVLLATANFTMNSNRGIGVGPASGTGSGEIDVAAGMALTYGGIIANNGGTGCLTAGSGSNTGTLALGGTNTYTGSTTVKAGVLSISARR